MYTYFVFFAYASIIPNQYDKSWTNLVNFTTNLNESILIRQEAVYALSMGTSSLHKF